MKAFLLMMAVGLLSCSPKPAPQQNIEPSEDYVLIEFASKLEEDYHRVENLPKGGSEADPHSHGH